MNGERRASRHTLGREAEKKKLRSAQTRRRATCSARLKLAELRRGRCAALYFICNLLRGRISWPVLSGAVILRRGSDGGLTAPLGSPGLGRETPPLPSPHRRDQHVWFVDGAGPDSPLTSVFPSFFIAGNMSSSVTFSAFWLTLDTERIGPETCGQRRPVAPLSGFVHRNATPQNLPHASLNVSEQRRSTVLTLCAGVRTLGMTAAQPVKL